jgi:hypothetical protein
VCSRLAFILGEIGDPGALPVLTAVVSRNRLCLGVEYVEYGIERIEEKTRSR